MTRDELAAEVDDTRPVFAAERRGKILEVVEARGRVRVRELAEMIGVTEPTIRKDIIDLHSQHKLRRTHGGAIALRPAYEPDIPTRESVNTEAKLAIARACLAEIRDGDAVFLDSGTTVNAISDLLAGTAIAGSLSDEAPVPRNVNVLTNSLEVARRLAAVGHIRHTVLGGQYRPVGACFVGPLAVSTLQQFTLNVAFIGVTGSPTASSQWLTSMRRSSRPPPWTERVG